jgi:hypothetical protein
MGFITFVREANFEWRFKFFLNESTTYVVGIMFAVWMFAYAVPNLAYSFDSDFGTAPQTVFTDMWDVLGARVLLALITMIFYYYIVTPTIRLANMCRRWSGIDDFFRISKTSPSSGSTEEGVSLTRIGSGTAPAVPPGTKSDPRVGDVDFMARIMSNKLVLGFEPIHRNVFFKNIFHFALKVTTAFWLANVFVPTLVNLWGAYDPRGYNDLFTKRADLSFGALLVIVSIGFAAYMLFYSNSVKWYLCGRLRDKKTEDAKPMKDSNENLRKDLFFAVWGWYLWQRGWIWGAALSETVIPMASGVYTTNFTGTVDNFTSAYDLNSRYVWSTVGATVVVDLVLVAGLGVALGIHELVSKMSRATWAGWADNFKRAFVESTRFQFGFIISFVLGYLWVFAFVRPLARTTSDESCYNYDQTFYPSGNTGLLVGYSVAVVVCTVALGFLWTVLYPDVYFHWLPPSYSEVTKYYGFDCLSTTRLPPSVYFSYFNYSFVFAQGLMWGRWANQEATSYLVYTFTRGTSTAPCDVWTIMGANVYMGIVLVVVYTAYAVTTIALKRAELVWWPETKLVPALDLKPCDGKKEEQGEEKV